VAELGIVEHLLGGAGKGHFARVENDGPIASLSAATAFCSTMMVVMPSGLIECRIRSISCTITGARPS